MLRLQTFAALDFKDAHGSEVRAILRQPKRFALLAYLVVAYPGKLHRRDSLLALFWPELDDFRARRALSQALHVLRRELGAGVLVSRGDEEVGVDPKELWCDAVAFEELLDSGEPEEALALFRGDFLPGFHLTDAPEFARWVGETSDRLRRRALAAATERAAHFEALGSLDEAAGYLRRAMGISPLDERAAREFIRVLDRAGDRAEALGTYRAFEKLLETEVGATPSPETQELIAEVRTRTATGAEAPERPPSPFPKDPPGASGPGTGERGESFGAGIREDVLDSVAGRRRTSHRWMLGMGVAGSAALIGLAIWFVSMFEVPPLDPSRVLVGEYGNRAGNGEGNGLAGLAAEEIIRSLAQSGIANPVAASSLDPTWAEASLFLTSEAPVRLRRLARQAGAGTVVWVFQDRVGDSIRIRSEIIDVESGVTVDAVEVKAAAESDLGQALEPFTQPVTGALATHIDPRFSEWKMGPDGSPSFEAYLEFVRGVESYLGRAGFLQPEGAIERFEEASRLDRGFLTPRVWTVLAHDAMGESDKADSLANVLAADDQLSLTDRYVLNHWLAAREGRKMDALGEMRRAMILSPRAEYMPLAVLAALEAGRPREAVRWMTAADTVAGWASHWSLFPASLAWAYHALGMHDLELAPARQASLTVPGNPYMLGYEVVALAALGHPDLNARLSEILEMELTPYQKGETLCSAAHELVAHGHRVAGTEMLNRCIQWDLERAQGGGDNIRHRLSWSLIFAGRFDEARPYLEELAKARPDNFNVIGPLAVLEAAQGNRDEADRLDQFIDAHQVSDSYWEGRKAYWRAAIAARLGNRPEAVRLLAETVAESGSFQGFHADLFFESLWDYPPFALLMEPAG